MVYFWGVLCLDFRCGIGTHVADDPGAVREEEYSLYRSSGEFKPLGYVEVEDMGFVNRSNDKLVKNVE